MTRDAAIDDAAAAFDSGAFQQDLAALVAYRTESQVDPNGPEPRRYFETSMAPRLKTISFTVEIIENPDPGGGPVLLADRIEDPTATTVLVYGHGDVIHGQDEAWSSGLAPFRLVERGDRLYGRGTADNKGQHLINLVALGAVLRIRGQLGFNVRVLIETGEEAGSRGLAQLCEAERAGRLEADVLIASDGPRLAADTPTLFMGSRGAISFDLVRPARGCASFRQLGRPAV